MHSLTTRLVVLLGGLGLAFWAGFPRPFLNIQTDGTPTDAPPTAVMVSATASEAPAVTATPSGPTHTPLPVVCNGSEMEPNDGGWGCVMVAGLPLEATLTFRDVDWFLFYGKAGWTYRFEALPQTPGVDPGLGLVELPAYVLLASNDDVAIGDLTARLDYAVPQTGYYGVVITSTGAVTGTYRLLISELPPTTTPSATRTPASSGTPTPGGGNTGNEPNNDWSQAKALMLGQPVNGQISNTDPADWWALRVKPGVVYVCRVTSGNFDPRLRVEQDGSIVGANDDVAPGRTEASVEWSVSYDAIAYPVVESTFGAGDYQLVCTVSAPTPTPTPRPSGGNNSAPVPTPVPLGVLATPVPPITPPTPTPRVSVPAFTPAPSGTPGSGSSEQAAWLALGPAYQVTPIVTTIRVKVFYDFNGNKSPEPDEGIEGLSVRALSIGRFVASGLTNAQGEANLVVVGAVDRVLIPFLKREKAVKPGQAVTFQVAVQTVKLPTFLPVAPAESK